MSNIEKDWISSNNRALRDYISGVDFFKKKKNSNIQVSLLQIKFFVRVEIVLIVIIKLMIL